MPDYDTGPKVQYPVAEEEMADVAQWVRGAGGVQGWDGQRLLLSDGQQLVAVGCERRIEAGRQHLSADSAGTHGGVPYRASPRLHRRGPYLTGNRPAISPFIQRLVQWAYFPDPRRRKETLASPRYDASLADRMPPTGIQTALLDTLAAEGRELADTLRAAGVPVELHQYDDADHDVYAGRQVLELIDKVVAFFDDRLHERKR